MSEPKVAYTKTDPARVSYDKTGHNYYIQEGLTLTASGKTSPRKFRLGQDEASARERALRLRRIWQQVKTAGHQTWPAEAEETLLAIGKGDWTQVFNLNALAQLTNKAKLQTKREVDPETLEIVTTTVPVPSTSRMLPVYLADEIANDSLPSKSSGTGLHKAIDDFAAYVEQIKVDPETHKTTQWGFSLSGQVRRLKDAIRDTSLRSFGEVAISEIVAYWKARPCRKGTQVRIDVTTVTSQIKALKYFLRWLPKNTGWKRCEYDDLLSFRKAELIFKSEKADLANGVPSWTVTELQTLYKYATPWERLFILCGLNCGFAQAEIISLRKAEIHFETNPHTIKRIRQKSTVYGELAMWAETEAGLQWAKTDDKQWAVVSENGNPLTYSRISNVWNNLLRRVRKDNPSFRFLSFKYLRKTAAQMIQALSNHYVASVFLFHGKRAADGQLTAYTNADYQLVFDAQAKMRIQLQPIFEAIQDPFAAGKLQGGANVSLGLRERIAQLVKEGIGPTEIARVLKVSRQTVYRWLPKADDNSA